MALSYCGKVLVFGMELRGQQGAHAAWGAVLVLGSALSYAVYLVYSGEMVKRLGRAAPGGAGHHRGLCAVPVAVCTAAALVCGAGGVALGWPCGGAWTMTIAARNTSPLK